MSTSARAAASSSSTATPPRSYLWRNVMHLWKQLGRPVACDLIGMGASDTLSESGPDRYHYAEHRNYLCTVRRRRSRRPGGVGLHDWGSALGFDWANRQRVRAADIAHMEAIAMPLNWSVFPDPVLGVCSRLPLAGRRVDGMRPESVRRDRLARSCPAPTEQQGAETLPRTLRNPSEDRRPTAVVASQHSDRRRASRRRRGGDDYGKCLAKSDVPKPFINGHPGARGRVRDFVRSWPSQTVTVPAGHFIQEDSPDEIGAAVAQLVVLRGRSHS
jgi:haloalkane dehalogenase